MPKEKEYSFTVVVEEIQGAYVAYALEACMSAADDDQMTAVFKLSKMLVRHIEFAEKNKRPEEIYHPAPQELWAKFGVLKDRGTKPLQETSKSLVADDQPRILLNQSVYAATC